MEASAAHTETGLPYAQADLIDHKEKDVPLANVKVIKDGESNFMSDDAFSQHRLKVSNLMISAYSI